MGFCVTTGKNGRATSKKMVAKLSPEPTVPPGMALAGQTRSAGTARHGVPGGERAE